MRRWYTSFRTRVGRLKNDYFKGVVVMSKYIMIDRQPEVVFFNWTDSGCGRPTNSEVQ